MTILQPPQVRLRLEKLDGVLSLARAAMFAVAIGVFLAAPPSLPWAIALVAATNVVLLIARAAMADSRPPISLLLLNGLTVTLVVGYAALSSTTH